MALYLVTFFLCFIVDRINSKIFKRLFLIWLYVFFCFGYTVGSDWRTYELCYSLPIEENNSIYILYNIITACAYRLGIDFWLYTGIIKCIFLYSLISVIKIFSNKIYCVLGLMMPSVLLFLLIDCPFKFMMALILLLFGFKFLIYRKLKYFIVVSVFASCIHFVSIFISILLLLVYFLKDFIVNIKFFILFLMLLLSTIISTSLSFFSTLSSTLADIVPLLEGKVESYSVETTAGWLTLGNVVNYIFFVFLYFSKGRILAMPYGSYLFSGAIMSKLLFGILLIIPSGFRFNIFNLILYSIALSAASFKMVFYKSTRYDIRQIVLIFTCIYSSYILTHTVYTSYVYLPYTNSIPRILSGTSGENYHERSALGVDEYYKRTGKIFQKE